MESLQQLFASLSEKVTAFRRDIHQYPELAWLEYRTTSKIAEVFTSLGYDIAMGEKAIHAPSRLTPPSEDACARAKAKAIIEGAHPRMVERMGDGLTGLWLDFPFTSDGEQGPLIAVRFDMDANKVKESSDPTHKPAAEGFSSQDSTAMHACGHDGHVAMGVGLGLALHALRTSPEKFNAHNFKGTIRLIFQPAEEIGQGAKAMLDAGVMHGVTELYGIHLGIQACEAGTLIAGTTHFLANTTFEVTFTGRAAHSGLTPEEGRNALLAASVAVQAMHGITRHSKGATRVNIGQLHVYGASNVVPSKAWLTGETRSTEKDVNVWMAQEAERMCQAAALMWDCQSYFVPIGVCLNGFSDEVLAQEVCDVAHSMACFEKVLLTEKFMASEDFTWFLEDVQQRGGQGTFIQLGVDLCGGHHNACFDFDEPALMRGVELLTRLLCRKLGA